MFGGWRILFSFNRNIWLYLLAWGLVAFGYMGVQGVLLNLYLLRLGYEVEFIGLLIASGQLVWAAAAAAGRIPRAAFWVPSGTDYWSWTCNAWHCALLTG